ncbi:MAG: L-serine ammonia-lyase [Campylobacterales bacterium]|nr:L-serine ammonia-lyase [Campylobacterales bacterium]
MYISLFDLYKIGIGPSSSHTFGPMVAAARFMDALKTKGLLERTTGLVASLHGSLGATGKGHLSDVGLLLGFCGFSPKDIPVEAIETLTKAWKTQGTIVHGDHVLSLTIHFKNDPLPHHENGMRFVAKADEEKVFESVFYSTGGGFIHEENSVQEAHDEPLVPYPFENALTLLTHCKERSLSACLLANELAFHTQEEIDAYVDALWRTMQEGMERGMGQEGALPAPTALTRRARTLYLALQNPKHKASALMVQMDWVNLFAMAVSEENANGGRVVTAPTNGACGIVPAVLMYIHKFIEPLDAPALLRFFLVSSAIGGLFKRNASISGAEVGCQGEVGVASSMAAAGLAEFLGASPQSVMMAAEIAMEHHLGLTCDPVNGQVQIPCIERNGLAAVTAINAASMALARNDAPARVTLDQVVEAMRQTGKDMNPKYRETSCGGLAVVF